MKDVTKRFLSDSLPNWFSAILLTLLLFVGQHMIGEFDGIAHKVQEDRERIVAAETQIKSLEIGIMDIRVSQRDVISELKAINEKLRK